MTRARIDIRKDTALILRNRGTLIQQGVEYDTFEISYENQLAFLRELIWYETNVKVIEPLDLRDALVELLSGSIR